MCFCPHLVAADKPFKVPAEVPQQHFLSASSQVSQGVCMTESISLISVLGVNRTGGVQEHGSGHEISVSVAKIPLAATSVCRCQTFDCLDPHHWSRCSGWFASPPVGSFGQILQPLSSPGLMPRKNNGHCHQINGVLILPWSTGFCYRRFSRVFPSGANSVSCRPLQSSPSRLGVIWSKSHLRLRVHFNGLWV